MDDRIEISPSKPTKGLPTQANSETHFRAMAARGSVAKGLGVLDKLDKTLAN